MNAQLLLITALLFSVCTSVHGDCILGHEEVDQGTRSQESGRYVDIMNPSECSGNLTAWHFCFYAEQIEPGNRVYTVFFQVWRQEFGNVQTLSLAHNSEQTMQISRQSVATAPPLVCQDVILTESEYFPVQAGDRLGVYIPFLNNTRPLHIIADMTTGFGLFYDIRGASASLVNTLDNIDLQERSDLGLHLYANITAPVASTQTSQPPPTNILMPSPSSLPSQASDELRSTSSIMPQSSMPPTVDVGGVQDSGGLSAGIIAAIVIITLLVLVVVLGIVILGIIIVWRRKRTGKLETLSNIWKGSTFSIDNAMYEIPPRAVKGRPGEYEIPVSLGNHEAIVSEFDTESEDERYIQMDSSVHRDAQHSVKGTTAVEEYQYAYTEADEIELYSHESEGEWEKKDEIQEQNRHGQDGVTDVLDIYASFGPSNSEYCRFMEQATKEEDEKNSDLYYAPPAEEEEIYEEFSKREIRLISREAVEITSCLGSGQFAHVNRGTWSEANGILDIAVKVLKEGASELDKIKFLQEAAIMCQFKHPNVVRLHGVIKERDMLMIVTEYMTKGDLKKCLEEMMPKLVAGLLKSKLLLHHISQQDDILCIPSVGDLVAAGTPQLLLSYSQQVALGMHYLASKGFVHRDLAARNIFVSRDNICKVGDFGMSRDLADSEYYVSHGGTIPVRWTAPEAVYYRKYSAASDIWSYGCLLYEIWSLGCKPFKGCSNTEVLKKVDSGYRLPPPPGCPRMIYEITTQCWNPTPSSRPNFRDILAVLLQGEPKVLEVPVDDASTHEHASVLGSSMGAGKMMYTDLQWKYLSASSTIIGNTANIYDIPENIEEPPTTIYTANHDAEYEDISETEAPKTESVFGTVQHSAAVAEKDYKDIP